MNNFENILNLPECPFHNTNTTSWHYFLLPEEMQNIIAGQSIKSLCTKEPAPSAKNHNPVTSFIIIKICFSEIEILSNIMQSNVAKECVVKLIEMQCQRVKMLP